MRYLPADVRVTLLALVAVLGAPLSGCSSPGGPTDLAGVSTLRLDDRAFAHTMVDLRGDETSLRDEVNGSYAIIDFWATWCVICRDWKPHLAQLTARSPSAAPLRVVGVALQDDADDVRQHASEEGMTWRQLVAPRAFSHPTARDLGITGVPRVYGVFPSGSIEILDLDSLDSFAAEAAGIPTHRGIRRAGRTSLKAVRARYGNAERSDTSMPGRTELRYARTNPLNELVVTTSLTFSGDELFHSWTTMRHAAAPSLTLTFSDESTASLLRRAERLIEEQGEEGIRYLPYLGLNGTTEAGAGYQSPFEPTIGRREHPMLLNPHAQDWSVDREASPHPGTYRLVLTLVAQTTGRAIRPIYEDLGVTWTLARNETVHAAMPVVDP